MNEQINFLIFAYYFAPSGGPRSIRWTNISRYLGEAGHTLTIICAKFPGDCEITDRSLLKISDHHSIDIQSIPLRACNPGIVANIRWSFAAAYAALRLSNESVDIVISSALPIWSHIAARIVIFGHNSKPWIADYGDPWSTSELRARSGIRRAIEKFIEILVLRRANSLTVTTEQASRVFDSVFPHEANINVIPQGASMFHISSDWSYNIGDARSKFRIVYTGGFYADQREPGTIFQALAELEEVELRIAGAHQMDLESYVQDSSLAERVSIRGYISLEEVVSEQHQADLLLLVANKVTEQIPGKLYEYLSTSKPILYVTDHLDDEVGRIIRSHSAGYVCRNTVDHIQDTILEILSYWRSGDFDNRDPLTDVGFDSRANSFEDLAKSLMDQYG